MLKKNNLNKKLLIKKTSVRSKLDLKNLNWIKKSNFKYYST